MDINTLKLVDDKPPHNTDRKIARRLRLAAGAASQAKLSKEEAAGSKTKAHKWYWRETDGSYRASLKFGWRILELAKGKCSVRCENLDEVSTVFDKLASMATAAQFDEQLERIAVATRKQFAKRRPGTAS